jgi:Icc-related predicted phosphoesterase
MESTVKTRFCLISDTHATLPFPAGDTSHAYRYPLPAADVLLHAGDLTTVGRLAEHEKMVNLLKNADAPLKIVIAGNHDITLDPECYENFGKSRHHDRMEDLNQVRELYCGEEARKHGVVYMEEGVQTFKLKNGAKLTVYGTPYQPEYYNWAFGYPRSVDRFNPPSNSSEYEPLNPIPPFPQVDVMLTHGPPEDILDEVPEINEKVGCGNLRQAVERCRPQLHCFGHIHEDWGAERMDWSGQMSERISTDRKKVVQDGFAFVDISQDSSKPLKFGQETLFVNAAIMDVHYHPNNAPWVVDLNLPRFAG